MQGNNFVAMLIKNINSNLVVLIAAFVCSCSMNKSIPAIDLFSDLPPEYNFAFKGEQDTAKEVQVWSSLPCEEVVERKTKIINRMRIRSKSIQFDKQRYETRAFSNKMRPRTNPPNNEYSGSAFSWYEWVLIGLGIFLEFAPLLSLIIGSIWKLRFLILFGQIGLVVELILFVIFIFWASSYLSGFHL